MRFELFDTNGKMRNVMAGVTADDMRNLVSKFKTHCAIENSAYEFNHFKNWAKKYHGVVIRYISEDDIERIDM
jgi:hypothetical protein